MEIFLCRAQMFKFSYVFFLHTDWWWSSLAMMKIMQRGQKLQNSYCVDLVVTLHQQPRRPLKHGNLNTYNFHGNGPNSTCRWWRSCDDSYWMDPEVTSVNLIVQFPAALAENQTHDSKTSSWPLVFYRLITLRIMRMVIAALLYSLVLKLRWSISSSLAVKHLWIH